MPSNKKIAAIAGLSLMVGATAWLVHAGKLPLLKRAETAAAKPESGPPAAAVSVVRAAPKDFAQTLLVNGTLVPREEILVGPDIEGLRIVEVLADEGDRVVKGQVLVRLVNDTLDAQLAQNAAALSRTSAAIQQARSNIVSAEARVVETRNNYDRGKSLRQSGYLSEANMDQRESAFKTAQAQLAAAQDALAVTEAEKAQVEAQRRELSWRRGRTDISAPADGVISRRIARVGGFAAGAGEPMFRIIARGEIELDAEVTETHIAQLRVGQPATVEVPGTSGLAGKVRLVSPEIDKASRLGRIRVSVADDPALRIGTFVQGLIVTATSRGLAVPSSSIQYSNAGPTVQVVADGRIVTRKVKAGLAAEGSTEIRDGLFEGDLVVARSGTFLREGDVVRPFVEQKQTQPARG
jgi:RND family efflux transporter MFP subunit